MLDDSAFNDDGYDEGKKKRLVLLKKYIKAIKEFEAAAATDNIKLRLNLADIIPKIISLVTDGANNYYGHNIGFSGRLGRLQIEYVNEARHKQRELTIQVADRQSRIAIEQTDVVELSEKRFFVFFSLLILLCTF